MTKQDTTATARHRRAARRFRQHLADGNLDHLLDARLGRLLAHAAEERGLAAEHGALRLVMHRLLTDEDDPSRLAAGVARLAHATARISQARRALAADAPDEFTQALNFVLDEINRPPTDDPWDDPAPFSIGPLQSHSPVARQRVSRWPGCRKPPRIFATVIRLE